MKKSNEIILLFNYRKLKVKKITSFIVSQIKKVMEIVSFLFLMKTKRNFDDACAAQQLQ